MIWFCFNEGHCRSRLRRDAFDSRHAAHMRKLRQHNRRLPTYYSQMNFRRYYIPGSAVFITQVVQDREYTFRDLRNVSLLRKVLYKSGNSTLFRCSDMSFY